MLTTKTNSKVLGKNPMITCIYHVELLHNFRNILVSDTYWEIYARKGFVLHKINFDYQTIDVMHT